MKKEKDKEVYLVFEKPICFDLDLYSCQGVKRSVP